MCEIPEFYCESFPKARKEHWCVECYWKIMPGQRYVRIDGKWEGEVATFRFHYMCHNLMQLANDHASRYYDCVHFGEALEAVREVKLNWFGERLKRLVARNMCMKRRYLREKEKIAS